MLAPCATPATRILGRMLTIHVKKSAGAGSLSPSLSRKFVRLSAGGKRIRTVGSAMRLHRRQRCRGVTPPDPGGERQLLGPPLDNSIGMPRPALLG